MSNRIIYALYYAMFLCVVLIIMVIYSTPRYYVLPNGARLNLTKCWFKKPKTLKAWCGYYVTPEEKKNQQHRFTLPVVYLQVRRDKPDPHPVLHINGGPGYATEIDGEAIYYWFEWIKKRKWGRDLILFDQRGTGMSIPRLDCPSDRSATLKMLASPLTPVQEGEKAFAFYKRCYRHLREQKLELDLINTGRTVQDIRNLSRLLQKVVAIRSYNIYSISYGTRVALELLKTKPGNIRAVVLDSVYPQSRNSLLVTPAILSNAIRMLHRDCRLSYICSKQVPNLKYRIISLAQRLDTKPVLFELPLENSKKKIKVYINGFRFIWAFHLAINNWKTIQRLPWMVKQASRGDFGALLPIIANYANHSLNPSANTAVYNSVDCHDQDRNISAGEYRKQVGKYSEYSQWVQHQYRFDACRIWKVGLAGKAFTEPTRSDIPVLILNGELDPVTPWYWARDLRKHLSKQFTFIIAGLGHGVVDSDECATDIAGRFFNYPNSKPALRCRQQWGYPDFTFDKKKTTTPKTSKPKTATP